MLLTLPFPVARRPPLSAIQSHPGTLSCCFALCPTAVAPSSSTNPNAPGQIKKQQKISGQLAIVTLDKFEQWVVRGNDGILIPIDKQAVKGPARVKSNNKQDGSLSNDVSIVDPNAGDVRSFDPNAGDTAQPLVGLYEDANFEPGSVVSMVSGTWTGGWASGGSSRRCCFRGERNHLPAWLFVCSKPILNMIN